MEFFIYVAFDFNQVVNNHKLVSLPSLPSALVFSGLSLQTVSEAWAQSPSHHSGECRLGGTVEARQWRHVES